MYFLLMDVDEARPAPLDVNTSTAVYADAAVATRVPLTIDMPLLRRPPLLSGAPDVPGVVAALRARNQTSLRCERPYADVNWLAPDEELYKVLLQQWLRLFALQYNAIRRDGGPVLHEAWRFFRQRTLLMSQRVGDAAVRWVEQILRNDDAYAVFANYMVELAPTEPDAGVRLVGELRARVGELEAAVRAQQDALTTALGATGMDVDERSTTALQDLIDERNKARLDYRRLAVVAMLPSPLRPVRLVDTARVAELTAKTTELEATVAAYKRQQQEAARTRLDLDQCKEDAARTQQTLRECAATTAERDRLRAQLAAGAAAYEPTVRARLSHFLVDAALPSAPLLRSLAGLVRASAPPAAPDVARVADLVAKNALLEATVAAFRQRQADVARTQLELDECRERSAGLAAMRKERDEYKQLVETLKGAGPARAGQSRFLIDAALPSAPLLRSLAAAARAGAAEASAAELRIQLEHEKRVAVAKGDEAAEARRALAAREAELAEARRAAADAMARMRGTASAELAAARRELDSKEAERAASAQALAAAQAQLAAAQRALDVSAAERERTLADIQAQLAAAQRALDANATEREAAERTLAAAIAQRDTAQTRVDALTAELDDAQRQAAAARRALIPDITARKEAEEALSAVRAQNAALDANVTELRQINAVARLRIARWKERTREYQRLFVERNAQLDACEAAQASSTRALEAELAQERQMTQMLQVQVSEYFARLRAVTIDAMLMPAPLLKLAESIVENPTKNEKALADCNATIASLRAQLDAMLVAVNQQSQPMDA